MQKVKKYSRQIMVFILAIATVLTCFVIMAPLKSSAAEYSCNSVATINSAIASANSAGSSVVTTIKLSGDISVGETAALTTITGNVVFDFNGHSLSFVYENTGLGRLGSNAVNVEYQLPSENQATYNSEASSRDNEYFSKAMFNVGSAGKMQIINSSSTAGSMNVKTKAGVDTAGSMFSSRKYSTITSSSLIYSEGTLIIGDKTNSGNNNFTLYAKSKSTNEKETSNSSTGYDKSRAFSNAFTVTVNNANAKLFMYGGTVNSETGVRSNHGGEVSSHSYALNIINCYSAEVYGGSVNNTTVEEAGMRNSDGTNSDSGNNYLSPIHSMCNNVYIFNVDSSTDSYAGSDTNSATLYTSNIYTSGSGNAYVYGGNFINNSSQSGSNLKAYSIRGPYSIATASGITSSYATDNSTRPLYVYTMFVCADSTTTNGVYPNNYSTFRDYVSAHTSSDAGFALSSTHIGDATNYTPSSMPFTRLGYTHTGWTGAKTPYGTTSASLNSTSAAGYKTDAGGSLFLFPTWTINTYTVTYDANGGSVSPTSATYNILSTALTVPTPTRTGYTFNGWTVSAVAGNWTTGSAVTSSISSKYGSITAIANWTANKYNLNYNANTGSVETASKQVTYDSAVGTLETPTKTAYDFTGWFTAASGGTEVTSATVYKTAGDSTVFAQWNPHTYTVSYDANGGSTTANTTYTTEAGSIAAAPTRTGYTFNGWQVVSNDGNWGNAGTTVSAGTSTTGKYGTLALKAIWSANKYTLNYNANTGSVSPASKEVTYDSAVGTLATPAKTAYDFNGWFTAATDGTQVTDSTVYKTADNSTIFAQWKLHTYTATYDSDGGVAVGNTTYNIEAGTLPAAPTRTGYTFSKWQVVSTDGNWGAAGTQYNASASTVGKYGSVAFKAIWTANQYPISFVLNDEALVGDATVFTGSQITATYDSAVGTLVSPSHTGYTFDGWYTAETGGTQYTASTIFKETGDVHLYAHWTIIKYEMTFANQFFPSEWVEAAGKVGTDGSATYDSTTGAITIKTNANTGYTNVTNSAAHIPVTPHAEYRFDFDMTNDQTQKNTNLQILFWDADGNPVSLAADSSINYGTASNGDVAKYIIGYGAETQLTPSTWSTSNYCAYSGLWAEDVGATSGLSSFGHSYIRFTAPANTAYITVAFGNNAANMTSLIKNINLTELYTVESGTFPTGARRGYTFSNWNIASTDGNWTVGANFNANDLFGVKYGKVTASAVWTANQYNLLYNLNDTTGVGSAACTETQKTVTFDSAVGELPTPTRTGYTFAGWFTSATGGTQITDTTVFRYSVDTTVYAHWTPIEYTITFNANNGTDVADVKYTIEDTVTLPASTRTGYTFSNWYIMSGDGSLISGNTLEGGATLPAGTYGNTTLRAIWSPNYYDITWIVNGASDTTSVGYGAPPSHEDPVITDDPCYDYTFTGWDPAVTLCTGEATYTAQFTKTPKEYKVTWLNEDDSVITSQDVAYGSTIPAKTVPAKTGYSGAWDVVPASMPASNVTIKAVYTINKYNVNWVVDGTTVRTDSVTYNTVPSFGSTPTKASSVSTVYTFKGWATTEGGTTVTIGAMPASEVTYYAVFTESVRQYTITWSINGTPTTEKVNYGETPVYKGETPTKASTATTDYTFSNWSPAIAAVASDATYTAQFSESGHPYTVTWLNEDDSVITSQQVPYGSAIPSKTVPSKAGYTGVWDVVPASMPASNVTIKAVYTIIKYNISWVLPTETITEKWDYGTSPSFSGSTPTKASTVDKVFTFIGWDKDIEVATKDATYTAQFSEATRKYTITWKNGTDTLKTEDVAYGSTPAYSGTTPTKAQTATTVYTFSGWTPTIANVTGAATYSAQFSEAARKYTVTWKNDDVTLFSEQVAYGSAIPAKDVPAKTGYTGTWDAVPSSMPASDVTINTVYTIIKYNISWVLPTETVKTTCDYGVAPTFPNSTPTKASTVDKVFTFSGWDKDIEIATKDATYTAQFTSVAREYTVTWMNGSTTLKTDSVAYGETPSYTGTTPTKAQTTTTVYTFSGWTPIIAHVTGAASYSAAYTESARKYTVTWLNENDTVAFTEQVENGSTIPTKAVPAKTGYTGAWDYTNTTMPTSNVTIKAVYTIIKYNISWVLPTETVKTTCDYGVAPTFPNSTPTKASTVDKVFTFSGWDKDIEIATKDATYTAQFSDTVRKYTITWNANGTITTEDVAYGETPAYKGATPTKASTATTDYTFSTWSPAITSVTGSKTYTAQFSEAGHPYTVTWKNGTQTVYTETVRYGSAIPSKTVPAKTGHTGSWDAVPATMPAQDYVINAVYTPIEYDITWSIDGADTAVKWDYGTTPSYGSTPVKAKDAEYTYTFSNWSPAVTTVTGNATYTAEFSKTANTYTITWKSFLNDTEHGGSIDTSSTSQFKYGDVINNIPGVPAVTGYAAAWDTIPSTMPSHDITINAIYTYGARTITWMINGAAHTTTCMDGDMPDYGSVPVKPADAEYSYSFSSWSPALTTVNGDATYTAQFTSTPNPYTVTWMADGVKAYDATVTFGSSVPTKAVPAKTGYTGVWDKTVSTMPAEDVTFTAVYTPIPYTITWNIDGNTTTAQWNYDTTPSYTGTTPVKASTATTDYTFTGWTPEISKVTGNKTYTAVFAESAHPYTVTWKNAGGSVLYSETVRYGETIPTKYVPDVTGYTGKWDTVPASMPASDYIITAVYTINKYTITWSMPTGDVEEVYDYNTTPSYKGTTPTKDSTVSTTFAFSGWSPVIAKATQDVTYTAQFTPSIRQYNITWDIEGVKTTEKWNYGETPAYTGATPTKASTATTVYTFSTWSPALAAVDSDDTYIAQFTESARPYTVTWQDADGSELYTASVPYGTTIPAKTVPAVTGYTGKWDVVPATMPASNVTIKAVYTINKYTVTWSMPAGDVEETYEYNTTPSYKGTTPTKDSTVSTTFEFSGWDKALDKVTDNVTYTAQFNSSIRQYTITWNIEGVKTTEKWNYGETPAYTGATPTKASTATTVYTFSTWSPALAAVDADDTYTAQFTESARPYTVTWQDANGSELYTESVPYGTTIPAKTVPTVTGYTGKWDVVPSSMPASNVIIKAVYTINEYTVTWNIDGALTTEQYEYNTTPAYKGATPTKASTISTDYTFKSWSPAISAVTDDITYTAQFNSSLRQYNITWSVNGKDTSEKWSYNTTPTFSGSTAKPSSATTDFAFKGWDKTITAVDSDETYTATYTETARKYTVTWVANGSTVYTEQVANGSTIPTKTVPSKTGYTGAWNNASSVMPTNNLTITAVYTPIKYTITWAMPKGNQTAQWDYDSTPSYNGTPVKDSTVSTEYTFTGWSPEITTVTGDKTYTAQFSETTRKYNITWIVDGKSTVVSVAYGTTPEFTGSTAKASSATTDYTFAAWDKTVTAVSGDATYTATYTESARKYTIKWVADGKTTATENIENGAAVPTKLVPSKTGYTGVWDKTVATMPTSDVTITAVYTPIKYTISWVTPTGHSDTMWDYDSTPVYTGETPTKAEDDEHTYVFSGWTPEVGKVTGETIYTAKFTPKNKSYKVTWIADGNVIDEQMVEFSTVIPEIAIPEKTGFTGIWNNGYTTMPARNITIEAVYVAKMYTIYWKADGLTKYAESHAFGDTIESKDVPAKDGYDGAWDNEYAVMPAQNVVVNAVYTLKTFTIKWAFDGTEKSDTLRYGQNYTTTFTGTLPELVRVMINGKNIDSEYYTYNNQTGEFTLQGSVVKADVSVFAKASGNNHNITMDLGDKITSSNNDQIVTDKTVYHTNLSAPAGYLLPDIIEVYVDGELLTSGYTYDMDSGRLTINAECVTGDISIVVEPIVDPDYVPPEDPTDPTEPTDNKDDDGMFGWLIRFFRAIADFFNKIFGKK